MGLPTSAPASTSLPSTQLPQDVTHPYPQRASGMPPAASSPGPLPSYPPASWQPPFPNSHFHVQVRASTQHVSRLPERPFLPLCPSHLWGFTCESWSVKGPLLGSHCTLGWYSSDDLLYYMEHICLLSDYSLSRNLLEGRACSLSILDSWCWHGPVV